MFRPVVHVDRLLDRRHEVAEPARVQQRAGRRDLAERGGEEVALPRGAVEVAVGQAVPLPDELQRLGALDRVLAGGLSCRPL